MAKKKAEKPETKAVASAPAPAPVAAAPVAVSKPAAPAPVEKVAAVQPVAAQLAQAVLPATKPQGFRRKLVGRVTSNKMDKTVTVEVIRDSMDPVYKKYVRQRERFKAHDATNQYKIGDRVEITEHRPISRDKRWLVTRLVSRQVQE